MKVEVGKHAGVVNLTSGGDLVLPREIRLCHEVGETHPGQLTL